MKARKTIAGIGKWMFLLVVVAFTLYPVIYALLGSFKTNQELNQGIIFFPDVWHIENYVNAFTKGNFGSYTVNSIILAVTVTLLALITTSLAGYLFARHEFPGKKFVMSMYMAFMFISLGSVTLYPLYVLLRAIGLTNNLLGMALAITGGQTANVLLVMSFTKSIPRELDEAAYIDGCSYFQVFYRIIIHLIKPILGVVALFSFRSAWNNYLIPLIMSIGKPNLRTLTVGVVQLKYSSNAAAESHIMLAGASIALIPVLLVYLVANKQFIAGLTSGGVKG
jgi:ABC-type sugar transport system, permease component